MKLFHRSFPPSFAERLEELRLFPDKGDMRSVRPSIRSLEMTLRRSHPAGWIGQFWAQVLRDTGCIDPSEGQGYTFIETAIDPNTLYAARESVIETFRRNIRAERVDARLDSALGLVLYALAHQSLNSVEPDAIRLVNEMMDDLEELFPSDEKTPRVGLRQTEAGTTAPNAGRENE